MPKMARGEKVRRSELPSTLGVEGREGRSKMSKRELARAVADRQ
jgi:hypothetical protein